MSSCDYAYSRYCDAADEVNETYGSLYPSEWRDCVDHQTEYLICLDATPEFLFSDHLVFFLEEFSILCREYDYYY